MIGAREGMLHLAPLIALLVGALLVSFTPRYGRLLALLSAAVAFLLTVGLVARPGVPLHLGSEETGLSLYAGGPGLILTLLVTFVIPVSIGLRFSGKEERAALVSALLLGAGAALFLLSHNSSSLYIGWGVLDLTILFALAQGTAPRTATRAMIINFTAGLTLLLSFLASTSSEGFPISPQLLPLLLLFASWVRWGLYPLQMVHVASEEIPFLSGSALQTVALATGGYLLTLYEWPRLAGVPRILLFLLAGLALFYGAFSTWRNPTGPKGIPWEIQREKRLCLYLAQFQMGLLALGLLAGMSGGQAVLPLTLGLVLALILLRGGMEVLPSTPHQRLIVKVALGIGVASLSGLPFTSGFAMRWLVYDSLLREGQGVIVALGALGSALIIPPLLEFITGAPDRPVKGEKGWGSVALLCLLVLPLVILGFYPQIALARSEAISEPFPSLAQLWNLPSSLPIWAAILLPLLFGYLTFRFQGRLLSRVWPFWERLAFLDLEGCYGALERVGAKICSGLRGVVMVVEGGSSGWLLLLALVVALILWKG